MQSPLSSAPLSRLDAVMWFLRVQLWLSVLGLLSSLFFPFTARSGFGLSLQNLLGASVPILISAGVPVLVLAVFPRVLGSAVLGAGAREPLAATDFRFLVGRCVGLVLFVHSLGQAIFLTLGIADALFSRGNLSLGSAYTSFFFVAPWVGTVVSFFLGFALAFGPAIRDVFRAR